MKTLAQKLYEARHTETAKRNDFIESEIVGSKCELEVETKTISIDEKNHTVTFVMSTSNIDRHGDIVDQESWMLEHFQKNPAFFLQHRADQFPIGKWLKVWLEADPDNMGKMRLVGTAEFRVKYDDAARAFDHVMEGDLNMVSVGFIPHRVDYDEDRDAFVLFDCELLECSLVGIGSNRQALAKEVTAEEVKQKTLDAKDAIDALIKSDDTNVVIGHMKARQSLNKALLQFKR